MQNMNRRGIRPSGTAALVMGMLTLLVACSEDGPTEPPGAPGEPLDLSFDFSEGDEGWEGGFAHYWVGRGEELELTSGLEDLPDPFEGSGFRLGGVNRSDDLGMYLTREVKGLEPGAKYTTIATTGPGRSLRTHPRRGEP